jgi:predicted nucleotidyltransferase
MNNNKVTITSNKGFIDPYLAKKNEEVIRELKNFGFVHSIILFGSRARGMEGTKSDVDLCIIPKPDIDINLKERIALDNSVTENIDISLLNELPVYIRKRVFLEGKVLYTQDIYYILTLAKENDLEYARYNRLKSDYHTGVMKRVRVRLR